MFCIDEDDKIIVFMRGEKTFWENEQNDGVEDGAKVPQRKKRKQPSWMNSDILQTKPRRSLDYPEMKSLSSIQFKGPPTFPTLFL